MGGSKGRFWLEEAFRKRAETLWTVYACTRAEDMRDELMEMYMPLTILAARRIRKTLPGHVDVEDLAADAALGLLNAIEQWRPGRSSFLTYSLKRMNGAMLDGLRGRDPVTRWGRMLTTRLMRARRVFREKHSRLPSIRELAQKARLPYHVCARHVGLARGKAFVSIEEIAKKYDKEGESPSDSDRTPDCCAEPDHERYFRDVDTDDFIDWLLAQIDDPQCNRICRAYLVEGVLQRDIARAEGVHETRIFQLLNECRAIWHARSQWLREEKEVRDGR